MRVELAYGERGLAVDLPDTSTVVETVFEPAIVDPAAALTSALRHPVGTPPLRELVRRGDRVAVAVCDGTRAQPRRLMVPAVLGEIDGLVDPADVVVLVATGTHRGNTPAELEDMLGSEVTSHFRVLNHDATDDASLADLGTVDGDVPALLSREWVDADVRVATGFVEPHFFAGFSGGPKMVAPGLAGTDTVHALHDAARIGHPMATWGVIEENPVQQGLRAVARLTPPHLSLDVVLNRRREITAVFAGEVFGEHQLACEAAARTAMREVDGPFDVVVTTNSGYPLDQNLYQAVKGMAAAARVVREGGLIVCAAECRDGLPATGSFGALLRSAESPEQLLQAIEAAGPVVADQWQVQILAAILRRARVALHSDLLSPADITAAHLEAAADVSATVEAELSRIGPAGRVCAIPEGPQTIPVLA